MVISSSTVDMSARRDYLYYNQAETVSLSEKAGTAVELEVSAEGKSLMEQLKEHQQEKKEAQEKQQQENLQKMLEQEKLNGQNSFQVSDTVKSKYELKLEMLRRMLEALQGLKSGRASQVPDVIKQIQGNYKSAASAYAASYSASVSAASTTSSNTANTGNIWTKTTVTSGFFTETESTAFETTGVAKTTDGREISFGVSVEMSRAFCAKYESFTQQDYVATDPLMINLDSNVASVSDMKFLFDIDADGTKEEVSLAGKGSGFLALDKNGDGTINDGSELFGTKSGDGFADLAAYDEDGNGWIDEADSIFKDLKVWTKDEDGNDILMDLKKADVGAIYLGNVNSQFSLNNLETNQTNGIVRKTGVYLKESGGVGTVQHVDLAV
jgi:O6-methylguanine-DNA--protein-cysteine methyltransferase